LFQRLRRPVCGDPDYGSVITDVAVPAQCRRRATATRAVAEGGISSFSAHQPSFPRLDRV